MRTGRLVRAAVASLTALGMCIPRAAPAAQPSPAPAVTDVALRDGGVLYGQVVDSQGGGRSGVAVSVRNKDRQVAAATTTAEGRFRVQGLRGGVYHLAAGEGRGVYRLWSAGTAPPSAQNSAVVYTQYGQYGNPRRSTWKMLLTNPLVVGGIVATAVVVPLELVNSRPSSP